MKRRDLILTLVLAVLAGFSAQTAWAQDEPPVPATLTEALTLPLCDEFTQPADPALTTAPEADESRTVYVFDLSSVERQNVLMLMRDVGKDDVALEASVTDLPLTPLDTLETDEGAGMGLFGWLVVAYDEDAQPACRSTGYPAVMGEDAALTPVTLQGFIAQMYAQQRLAVGSYLPQETCTFETPQNCDAIFRGEDADETITGTAGRDLITAGGGSDTVNAQAGNDAVDGGGGNDVINGGDGDDVIVGGDGDDVIIGGSGGDVIRGGDGGDVIRGGDGNDVIRGDGGLDTVSGDAGVDTVDTD